jgi:hypothetical protein
MSAKRIMAAAAISASTSLEVFTALVEQACFIIIPEHNFCSGYTLYTDKRNCKEEPQCESTFDVTGKYTYYF